MYAALTFIMISKNTTIKPCIFVVHHWIILSCWLGPEFTHQAKPIFTGPYFCYNMFAFLLSALRVIALHCSKEEQKQWWSCFSASTVSPEDCSTSTNFTHSPRTRRRSLKEQGRRKKNFYILGGARTIMITLHSPCCSRKTNKNKDECPSVCQCKCHCLHLVRIYNRCEWCTTSIASLPCLSTMKLLTREEGGATSRSTMTQRRSFSCLALSWS